MDIASLIGLLIAFGCMGFVGFEASHGHWSMFYSQEGVFMVFGGSVSVVFMAMPMDKLKAVPGYIRRFLFNKGEGAAEVIKLMSTLSEKARREGMISLQSDIESIKNPFLKAGLRMVVDGASAGTIEATLRMELLGMSDRHKAGKKFFDLIKVYGPGYGLVGTLVGQVGMFGQLGGSVEAMGKMLAVAVVATMYGAIIANAIAGPIGDKLGIRSGEEMLNCEMILAGILSIQSGDNPRLTLDKMLAFLPNSRRAKVNPNPR